MLYIGPRVSQTLRFIGHAYQLLAWLAQYAGKGHQQRKPHEWYKSAAVCRDAAREVFAL